MEEGVWIRQWTGNKKKSVITTHFTVFYINGSYRAIKVANQRSSNVTSYEIKLYGFRLIWDEE